MRCAQLFQYEEGYCNSLIQNRKDFLQRMTCRLRNEGRGGASQLMVRSGNSFWGPDCTVLSRREMVKGLRVRSLPCSCPVRGFTTLFLMISATLLTVFIPSYLVLLFFKHINCHNLFFILKNKYRKGF